MDTTESTELTEEAKKKLGAKECSKVTMAFACAWIATLTILRGLGWLGGLTQNDIIYSGITIAAIWSPTYLSVWLDKIRDIRLGGAE